VVSDIKNMMAKTVCLRETIMADMRFMLIMLANTNWRWATHCYVLQRSLTNRHPQDQVCTSATLSPVHHSARLRHRRSLNNVWRAIVAITVTALLLLLLTCFDGEDEMQSSVGGSLPG
jgi:hypothetical protein